MKVEEYFLKQNFEKLIEEFFRYTLINEYEIYNEFSFQHELGFFLRNKFIDNTTDYKEYKIEFERNTKYFDINYKLIKKEIDISIYNNHNRFAIELKYPLNGRYPEEMFDFIKDIKFIQQLKDTNKFNKTYSIVLVNKRGKGRPFYMGNHLGNKDIDIYKYFRGDKEILRGKILKPTGYNKYIIDLKDKEYKFLWKDTEIYSNNGRKYKECKYYIINSI